MGLWRDERGVVVGWLTKIAIFFGVAAFVLYNLGAIVVNSVGLSSDADDIANQLSTTLVDNPHMPLQQLADQGQQIAAGSGARLVRVWVKDGVLYVKLKRPARVMGLLRVHALRPFVVAKQTGHSGVS